MRPFDLLHPYQVEGIDFLLAASARQLIAIMGAGKTAIALHSVAALKLLYQLDGAVVVLAPLMIADTVWTAEAKQWEQTAGLVIERVIGTPKQRCLALDRPADVYVSNYDNLKWLVAEIHKRGIKIAVLVADEASALKNPEALRTRLMIELAGQASRRWALTGTPRGYGLSDVWGPAQFVTQRTAFPPFLPWRNANFYPIDQYMRVWRPRAGVEETVIEQLRPFTWVVDRAALRTRPPVVEIVHDIALPPEAEAIYRQFDQGTTADLAKLVAAGLTPSPHIAVVGKLMQTLSGAVYGEDGEWVRLHDRRLDMLQELHKAHDRPTLVFCNYRHEIERIRQCFPFAVELGPTLIDAWNAGTIEMLIAHPASAGHGVNLQYGSDTVVWFTLPWSAELYTQAIARVARQGQGHTVNVHLFVSFDKIDSVALAVVRRRISEQDGLIEQLRRSA
jgi:hypothetical protein